MKLKKNELPLDEPRKCCKKLLMLARSVLFLPLTLSLVSGAPEKSLSIRTIPAKLIILSEKYEFSRQSPDLIRTDENWLNVKKWKWVMNATSDYELARISIENKNSVEMERNESVWNIAAVKRRDKSRREIVINSRTMNIIPENLISSFSEHFVIDACVHVQTARNYLTNVNWNLKWNVCCGARCDKLKFYVLFRR